MSVPKHIISFLNQVMKFENLWFSLMKIGGGEKPSVSFKQKVMN